MKDKAYEEVGHLYRYFLTWRHAAVAGAAVVGYGALSVASSATDNRFAGWVLILAAGVFAVLWMIDVRTRDLYRFVMAAGAALEETEGLPGFYKYINEKHQDFTKLPFWQRWPVLRLVLGRHITHSAAISLLFAGMSGVFTIAGIVFLLGLRR